MKINWGTGAFMLFGAFALFMTGLAIFAAMQRHELVATDYYEKELEFKETQKKQEQTAKLSEPTQLTIEKEQLVVLFPKDITTKITGNLVFFKPSNQKDDKTIDFTTTTRDYKLPIATYSSGMYKLKINWQASGVAYYDERQIVLP